MEKEKSSRTFSIAPSFAGSTGKRNIQKAQEISKRTFEQTQLPPPSSDAAVDFQSPQFDKKYFTRKLFTLKKPEEIQEFIGTIQEKKEDCGKTLKKQVFSHYSNLINSTGHIQQLENDLTTLRKLFTDQQQIFFSLSNSASTPSALSTSNVVSSLSSTQYQLEEKENPNKIFDILDSLIAERRFQKAVETLEQELKQKEKQKISYKKKLEKRIKTLSALLCSSIQNPSMKPAEAQKLIQYLIRLGEPSLARHSFLSSKLEFISKDIREMKVEGELVSYISKLSQKVFGHISDTCKEYLAAFSQPVMMSAYVVWATQILDLFGSIFCRHVFNSDNENVPECLDIARQHCLMLENDGLQLSFSLNQILNKYCKDNNYTC